MDGIINYKNRFVRNLPNGLGSTMVFLGKDMYNKDVVVKQCIDVNDYKKEKETLILLKNSIYTPKLIEFCDKSLYLVSEWCGNDLRNLNYHYKMKYLPHIRNIVKNIYLILNILFLLITNTVLKIYLTI